MRLCENFRPSDLKRYNRTFPIYVRTLFGVGTQLTINEISVASDGDRSVIKAEITVSAGGKFEVGYCAICGSKTPEPDADALWFVLENHDGNRLLFPVAEDAADERDCWPVTGWAEGDDGLVCPECQAELAEAKKTIAAKRKR